MTLYPHSVYLYTYRLRITGHNVAKRWKTAHGLDAKSVSIETLESVDLATSNGNYGTRSIASTRLQVVDADNLLIFCTLFSLFHPSPLVKAMPVGDRCLKSVLESNGKR